MSDALEKLPKGLDEAYKEAMKRIKGQGSNAWELAKEVLSWITCAIRPLTTLELRHALAIEAGKSELDEKNLSSIHHMVSVCAGLVTVDKTSGIFRLVHYTTQEYFERTRATWFPDAATVITTACVYYLSFTTFESGYCSSDDEFEDRLRLNPLYDYAARYWGQHYALSASTKLEERVVHFLLKSEANVSASSQAMMTRRGYSQARRGVRGAHLAANFGLEEVMTALLTGGVDPDCKDDNNQTPLLWAAKNGHKAIVKLLLDTKKVGVDLKDSTSRTPLSWAAMNGHEAIVKLLLDTRKVDVNSKDSYLSQTPLLLAARNGQEAVVKLLLNTEKVDVNLKDFEGWTPLSRAAENGQEAVVKLLLNAREVDVNLMDFDGQTPLSRAAENGHEAIVKLLLNIRKVDVDLMDFNSKTPLLRAAENGHEAVVKLLLDTQKVNVNFKGFRSDLKGFQCQTPLLLAAGNGHEAVVKLLLDIEKVAVNFMDHTGRTPLSWAAENGHEAVVKLLLNITKVDIDLEDVRGSTPISKAIENGHEAIVKLLLDSRQQQADAAAVGREERHKADKKLCE